MQPGPLISFAGSPISVKPIPLANPSNGAFRVVNATTGYVSNMASVPSVGNTVVMFVGGVGRSVNTAPTQTGVTWTQITTGQNGSGLFQDVWFGSVVGPTVNKAITLAFTGAALSFNNGVELQGPFSNFLNIYNQTSTTHTFSETFGPTDQTILPMRNNPNDLILSNVFLNNFGGGASISVGEPEWVSLSGGQGVAMGVLARAPGIAQSLFTGNWSMQSAAAYGSAVTYFMLAGVIS